MEGVDHLDDERRKAQFDVDEMKIVWAGSKQTFEVSDRISKLVANDPVSFFLPLSSVYLSIINFVLALLHVSQISVDFILGASRFLRCLR